MTTTITIKHDGPDHKNVKVEEVYDPPHEQHNKTVVLKMGQTHTCYVYDVRRVRISETDEPASEA